MVEPELVQAGIESATDRLRRQILVPDFCGDVQLAARHAGNGDGRTDRVLVGIHLGGVDVAIADRQRTLDRGAADVALHAEGAEAELGHADALCIQMLHEQAPDVIHPAGRAVTDSSVMERKWWE